MFLQISGGKKNKKNVNVFAQKMSKYCLHYPSRELFPYVYREFILEIKSLCPFGWMKVTLSNIVGGYVYIFREEYRHCDLHVACYVLAFTF